MLCCMGPCWRFNLFALPSNTATCKFMFISFCDLSINCWILTSHLYSTIQLKFDIALLTKLRSAHTPYEMAQCSCTAEQLRVKDLPKVPVRWLRLWFEPTTLWSQGNELHHCATVLL